MAKEAGYFSENRERLREQVRQLEADWFAQGGVVTHCKRGATGIVKDETSSGWRSGPKKKTAEVAVAK